MNWKQDSLGYYEFVSPITSVVLSLEDCEVKHYLDLKPADLCAYSKIILSGTTLKDNVFLKQIEKFNWIKTFGKPILGICAGMQIISLVLGGSLNPCLEIGTVEIHTHRENPLFQGTFNVYTLHNYSVIPSRTFMTLAQSKNCVEAIKHKQKNIYGLLFHPEVRNPEIIKQFIKLET
jgi:GMP synthase (glutamine-hydrolysing)